MLQKCQSKDGNVNQKCKCQSKDGKRQSKDKNDSQKMETSIKR